MSKAIAILIDPQGNEWFSAYGPKTKLRDKASRYTNAAIAVRVACDTIYGNRDAFWNSERQHAENTRREHQGWSYRVEEVSDDDKKREGWSVARYESGSPVRHYHAIGGGFTTEEGNAALWPTRPEAMQIAKETEIAEGWYVCVDSY